MVVNESEAEASGCLHSTVTTTACYVHSVILRVFEGGASSSAPRLPLCQILFLACPALLSQPMEKNRVLDQSLSHSPSWYDALGTKACASQPHLHAKFQYWAFVVSEQSCEERQELYYPISHPTSYPHTKLAHLVCQESQLLSRN